MIHIPTHHFYGTMEQEWKKKKKKKTFNPLKTSLEYTRAGV